MTDTALPVSRSATGFDLTPPTPTERVSLEKTLSREEREVLLHHGTEAPFCGGLLDNKEDGAYCCRLCGLPLFQARTKFESGTGWPSFWKPLPHAVEDLADLVESFGGVPIMDVIRVGAGARQRVAAAGAVATGTAMNRFGQEHDQ